MICNELLLVINLLVVYGSVLLWFRLFSKTGLYAWIVLSTIAANIEVLIVIEAFGMEQTLGNIMFASTFLVTDILSEMYGKEKAEKGVRVGIAASLTFVVVSNIWLGYTPAADDWAFDSIKAVFSHTPRLMLVSLAVYVIVQLLDVTLYHKIWAYTERKFGDRERLLWLRNNAATMISQLLNSFLFNFGAFWGTYDFDTLVEISLSGFVIYFVTSLLDTPFLYAARRIYRKQIEKGDKGEPY